MRKLLSASWLLVLAAACRGDGSLCCGTRPACVPVCAAPPPSPQVVRAPAPPVARAPAKPAEPKDVEGPGYRGIVLTPGPDQWTPSLADIARLEAGLPEAMRRFAPGFSRPLTDYFRQYVGAIEDGRRLIVVHGMTCEDVPEYQESIDLHRVELQVMDGGDSLFFAVYDPATGTFEEAGPHGEA